MENKNPILSFWQKSWWNKTIFVFLGVFILLTIIGLSTSKKLQSLQAGYKASKDIVSSSTPIPTPAGKGAAKQISVCPTKTTSTYTVTKCVILLDAQNKPYNSLYVVISPSLSLQEAKVKSLANTIKTNECPKSCSISIFDGTVTANKAFTFDLLSEIDQKKWEKNNPTFFAVGGELEKHLIATYDTEGNTFDYMIEPPILSPQRKIVKGSTPKGVEFYDKVEALRKQGRVNGELCTEFESDQIVDVNPESPAVQLSLMYPSITGGVKSSDKNLILSDFKVIKALAEQDRSMVLPEYGTLRLFVLTFHDSNCIAKGDLQQLMIDDEPEWMDFK